MADLAWYALVVTGVVIGVAAVLVIGMAATISFPIGGTLLVVKYVLFVVGILVVAIAAFLLRPRAAWKEPKSAEERTPTRLETLIQRLPPLRDRPLAPDERISPPAKLLVGGLVMLAVSFVLETWFGVTV